MTNEMSDKYDANKCEAKWASRWIKDRTYTFDPKSKKESYIIDTPPPTVSGSMHAGHAFSYSQQDFIARYNRMKGKNVFYPFGTDDNGLPTERLIEKTKKVESTKMDRAEFVALCDKTIKEIQPAFIQDWIALGMSCDFSTPYSTINAYCQKTSQTSFIDLYKKGYVYQSETPISWCVKCQTAIAQAEFENVELDSHFNDIIFKSGDKELIISTTRPELIPACVGLFFNPADKRYKGMKGKFAKVPLFDYEVPILPDENVDTEKGTGIMMCCSFGDKEDVEKWHKHNLELRVIFEKYGKLNELAGKYKGLKINDARKEILNDLKEKGHLKKQSQIKHNVNVHDKCGTEIEYLKTKQWYIKILDKKHELLEAADKIKWYPEHMKKRFVHWVENLNWDWCVSRQRHFGIPFPLWYDKKTGEVILADESQLPVYPARDLPKNYKGDKKNLIAEEDVFDTWATSSVSPQIILDWKGKSGYGAGFENFPCTLRQQAHDLIRTWAFYTIVKSLYHHNKAPWKNIMISGHALDAQGRKMSKSLGNVVSPQDLIKKYGADAVRLWAATTRLGDDIKYREDDVKNGQKTVTKLWNASKFVFMHLKDYGNICGRLELMDKWMLIKANKVIKEATDGFESYEYSQAKRAVEEFFWGVFCDNYLEIVKDRLYNPDKRGNEPKLSAQCTLYKVMLDVLKMFAPLSPFVTEEIFNSYYAKRENLASIHTTAWPQYEKTTEDKNVEALGDRFVALLSEVRKYKSSQGKSLKEEVKITLEDKEYALLKDCMLDFKAACNAKEIISGKKFSVSF